LAFKVSVRNFSAPLSRAGAPIPAT